MARPPQQNCHVPTDDAKLSRRSFLSGVAVLGTMALAGCAADGTKESSIGSQTLPQRGIDLKPEEEIKMATPTTTVNVPTNQKAVVITVEIDSGRVAGVQAINGGTIQTPTPADVEGKHQGLNGFKHLTTIYFSHSSPGCLYWFAGSWRQGC